MDLTKPPENNDTLKPDSLSVNKMISITEPLESPIKTPDDMVRTPEERSQKHQQTPTINEENETDEISQKSSLSLPVEAPPSGLPIEKDRRKLSVQGLMAFAERRRSSSTFADVRKMSISNGDGVHIRSPGGVGTNFFFYFFTIINKCMFSHTWRTTDQIETIVKDDKICGVLGCR